jgi:hypothetical protein
MTDAQEQILVDWSAAWRNIKADFNNGTINNHQFMKEQEYMRSARIQIEKGEIK